MTLQKFNAGTIIRQILKADPKIAARVKSISPITAPKETDGDFIIYQRDEYTKEYNNMGYITRCNVYVICVSTDYDRSIELAGYVDAVIEGEHPQHDITARFVDSTEDFADGKYFQVLLFTLK